MDIGTDGKGSERPGESLPSRPPLVLAHNHMGTAPTGFLSGLGNSVADTQLTLLGTVSFWDLSKKSWLRSYRPTCFVLSR